MIRQKIVAAECPLSGELGLFVDGVPRTQGDMAGAIGEDAGRLIAHDIVEHRYPHRIGTVDDECCALGAVWYVRGQFGDLSRGKYAGYHSPEESLGSDFARLIEYGTHLPKITARPSRVTDGLDYVWDGIAARALRTARDENPELDYLFAEQFMARAQRLARFGIRQCRDRWGPALHANNVFWNIAEEVNRVARWVDYEGQEWVLRINNKTAAVSVEEVQYEEYY